MHICIYVYAIDYHPLLQGKDTKRCKDHGESHSENDLWSGWGNPHRPCFRMAGHWMGLDGFELICCKDFHLWLSKIKVKLKELASKTMVSGKQIRYHPPK